MLTSPVNVTIAANGVALKANTAASDHSARREPPLLPVVQAQQQAEMVIEPELPSNSPLTNGNALATMAGNRTVLQELTLNVATMLKIARRADESLTSLFLRVIATIEAMPPAERLQLEIRAGLKPLKITLADLAVALRKPDGREAAHLTALAEMPMATPGRTAANAATTTYLEEGTDSGHTEEALAMRAAARHSAAGQSVFSAESKARHADTQPADAKVLQNHLMTMFEPGDAGQPDAEGKPIPQDSTTAMEQLGVEEGMNVGKMDAGATGQDAAVSVFKQPTPSGDVGDMTDAEAPDNAAVLDPAPAKDGPGIAGQGRNATARDMPPLDPKQPISLPTAGASENVTFSSANLKLDPPAVEKIRSMAQAIATQAEATHEDQEHPVTEKGEDRRVQTMLTLKGLAEVVTAIPARAAELLAIVVAEAAAQLPYMADEKPQASDEEKRPEFAVVSDELVAENVLAHAEEMPIEIPAEANTPTAAHTETQAEIAAADEHRTAPDFEGAPLARPDLTQHAVPFAYAQAQPARETMSEAVEEEDAREETDEDGANDRDEDGEPRRPRDEYDAIHDPIAEGEDGIVINRDSSEADRAFALYQRMGGF